MPRIRPHGSNTNWTDRIIYCIDFLQHARPSFCTRHIKLVCTLCTLHKALMKCADSYILWRLILPILLAQINASGIEM